MSVIEKEQISQAIQYVILKYFIFSPTKRHNIKSKHFTTIHITYTLHNIETATVRGLFVNFVGNEKQIVGECANSPIRRNAEKN